MTLKSSRISARKTCRKCRKSSRQGRGDVKDRSAPWRRAARPFPGLVSLFFHGMGSFDADKAGPPFACEGWP